MACFQHCNCKKENLVANKIVTWKILIKKHTGNKIYQTKSLNEVSWFQPKPETSLNFFSEFKIAKDAKIIDIGGGDSLLVDHLLDLGYSDITVLDISEAALTKAKLRLGNKSRIG